jgi:hypothetical protein
MDYKQSQHSDLMRNLKGHFLVSGSNDIKAPKVMRLKSQQCLNPKNFQTPWSKQNNLKRHFLVSRSNDIKAPKVIKLKPQQCLNPQELLNPLIKTKQFKRTLPCFKK